MVSLWVTLTTTGLMATAPEDAARAVRSSIIIITRTLLLLILFSSGNWRSIFSL